MNNVVVLPPSDFILAISHGSLSPAMLMPNINTATDTMIALYSEAIAEETQTSEVKIVIGRARCETIILTEGSKPWCELIEIAMAARRNGRTTEDSVKVLVNKNFKRYMLGEDDTSKAMRRLFDQAFHYTINSNQYSTVTLQ